MQGPIVQTVGLVLALNACRKGLPPTALWPSATIFEFCRHVRFVDAVLGDVIAGDPSAWVEQNCRSARGARLHVAGRDDLRKSDRDSVGFVGGGPRWIIETVGEDRSDLWESAWSVLDGDASDRRIWGVDYFRIARGWRGGAELRRPLEDIRHELEHTILAAIDFATVHNAGFVVPLTRGLNLLRGTGSDPTLYHTDLVPPGLLAQDAQQLLSASQAAWVFGGMGSWNDMCFEGKAERLYSAVTDSLFSTTVEAVAAATNSSFPDTAGSYSGSGK